MWLVTLSLPGKFLRYFLIVVTLAIPHMLSAQEKYGLEFASKGIDPDRRTGVNFFPDKPFVTDNFSLAFDLSFLPDAGSYFGYVFRLTDEKDQHIDLVFNVRTSSFDLIGGNAYSGISFKVLPASFVHQWHHFRLDINNVQHTFTLWMNGQAIGKAPITFPAGNKWTLTFGANLHVKTKIIDIPPMRLRDVKIFEDNQLRHHWPLDQDAGFTATDIAGRQTAAIDNPIWLAYTCRNWQLSRDVTTMGNASVAFDSDRGIVYILGRDSVFYYDCARDILKADRLEQAHGLPAGNQAVFGGGHLYNFLTDFKKVAMYDGEHHTWDFNADKDSVTRFWHANRFYAPFDSAIYIIGGYGYYHFTNQVQRYSTTSHTWDTLASTGDKFTPRYMAALGTTPDGDSAYIVGGYGSTTGDQLLDPHNLYDLHLFDVKARRFRKIYELPAPEKPFAFGRSMIIDTRAQCYYALTLGNDKAQSSLQLIKGSLQRPEYTKLAGEIPFCFFDIRSAVELFYYKKGQKLISVVLFNPENHVTQVRIYSVQFPPAALTASPAPSHHIIKWLLAAIAICLTGLLLIGKKYMPRIFRSAGTSQTDEAYNPVYIPALIPSQLPDTNMRRSRITISSNEIGPIGSPRARILLFGQFTVLDREGNDITRLFSPLVKELFLLFLLHSLPDKKGITSEKINETLWPGRAVKDAKNNRSVNIVKLKNILDKLGHYTLEKETDKWLLHFDNEQVDIDLLQYFSVASRKNNEEVQLLVNMTNRGALLAELEYSWLDKFKSDITAEITALFINILHLEAGHSSPELIIAITNCILHFDPLSEEAIMFKCRALVALKQHASARVIYNNFAREYKDIYGEIFEKEYQEMLVD